MEADNTYPKRFSIPSLLLCFILCSWSVNTSGPKLLVRIDDIGMNHSVNMALKELANSKMRLSASVMFACPWYQEAVEILKENPQIAVGVHLTLNSEWKNYRWGPVLGKEAVPSLVDKAGYFLPSTEEFLESGFKPEEVEKELDAQIKRALSTGLKIEYIDFHMRTALATPELKDITIRLAKKYNLRRSMFMDEKYKTMYDTEIGKKKTDFINHLKNELDPKAVNLVIVHAAKANPEMRALVDMNNPEQHSDTNEPTVALHREAELNMLLSDETKKTILEKDIQLVNYADLPRE